MPWKECHVVDERLRFIARLLDGEKMARLCAEFGISRKTGYKIYDRYKDCGAEALTDRSRGPYRYANRLPPVVEQGILRLKREYPSWGAGKIRERLRGQLAGLRCPAISTVHAVLDRHGLVTPRRRRRYRAEGTALSQPTQPNELWCADDKASSCWRIAGTATRSPSRTSPAICSPVTRSPPRPRSMRSRPSNGPSASTAFPALRTDNGVPFASAHALDGLSRLAVWWLRLGIAIERIRPGHPEQNGRHERMHLTLKLEATKPAAGNVLQQQARFDAFQTCYNRERPHQALGMKVPGERDVPSSRPYRGLPTLDYPLHDWTATVTSCGRICFKTRKVNLSQVFAGQAVGVRQVDDHIGLVTFMHYDLGYFDDETCRLEPIDNPFRARVLPMSPE
jgi:putative transposase